MYFVVLGIQVRYDTRQVHALPWSCTISSYNCILNLFVLSICVLVFCFFGDMFTVKISVTLLNLQDSLKLVITIKSLFQMFSSDSFLICGAVLSEGLVYS
jgi:hypothetical protein